MSVRDDIRALADEYAHRLKEKIDERVGVMDADDKSHFLIYSGSRRLRRGRPPY